jgi:hypothetical protein
VLAELAAAALQPRKIVGGYFLKTKWAGNGGSRGRRRWLRLTLLLLLLLLLLLPLLLLPLLLLLLLLWRRLRPCSDQIHYGHGGRAGGQAARSCEW